MSPRNLAIAAALGAAFLLMVFWLTPSGSVGGLAFAEVQQQVEKARSVQFTETEQRHRGKKSGPKIERRVMILGRYLMRAETKVVAPGDKLEGGARWGASAAHIISITDAKAGKSVHLIPEMKLFTRVQGYASVSPDDGSIKIEKIKPMPEADFYEQVRRFAAGKVEKLPEQMIDGKRAVGFRFVERGERTGKTLVRNIWVDPATKLPIRMEATYGSPRGPNDGDAMRSEFIWDAPLDPALFSTEPPEGYTVTTPPTG